MTVEAKIGIFKDRLVHDGVEYPVRREHGGWVSVPSLGDQPGGRIRYDHLHDRIRIESAAGSVTIPFRWRHTVFSFGGHRYRVGPMAWGHVMVSEEDRPVVTGRLTPNGCRLGYVAPELAPVANALAVGFAFRAVTLWLLATTASRA